jgi:hypothetical protein
MDGDAFPMLIASDPAGDSAHARCVKVAVVAAADVSTNQKYGGPPRRTSDSTPFTASFPVNGLSLTATIRIGSPARGAAGDANMKSEGFSSQTGGGGAAATAGAAASTMATAGSGAASGAGVLAAAGAGSRSA